MSALWAWLSSAFSSVLSGIWAAFGWALSWFVGVWNDVLAFFVDWYNDPVSLLGSTVRVPVEEFLNVVWVPGGLLRTSLELISYFVPVVAVVALIGAGYAACAIIRLVRWVKSFVPLVGD